MEEKIKKTRKVLISFIGTGAFVDNDENKDYRKATYTFPSGEKVDTEFIADALRQKYAIDATILIGTVKSMWDNVYLKFCQDFTQGDEYFNKLYSFRRSKKTNYQSSLDLPESDKMDAVLGDGGKAVVVHYGLNREELLKNSEIILGIEDLLRDGDELYLDITHSFRSLPVMLMNTIMYLQEVSQKKIKIMSISYGMLDASRELGYTPVVELNSILEINEWIRGAYILREFGDASIVGDRLSDSETKEKIQGFSDVIHVGVPGSMRSSVSKISTLVEDGSFDKENAFARMLLNPVLSSFVSELSGLKLSEVQYNAARWQYLHRNYGSSFLILQEAIKSKVVEMNKQSASEDLYRSAAEKALNREVREWRKRVHKKRPKQNIVNEAEAERIGETFTINDDKLLEVYDDVRDVRNNIAHALFNNIDATNAINNLGEYLKSVSRFFGKY